MSDLQPNQVGHEQRDVRFTPVLIGGGLIIALTLAAVFGMIGVFDFLAEREAERSVAANPLAESVRREPPEPRLQALPILDLETLRAAEKKILEGYSWVDREAGVARIPIERAMEILAQRKGQRGAPAEP